MIARGEWTQRPAEASLRWGAVVGAVIHWTGIGAPQRGKDWRALMRAVQTRDMDGPENMVDIEYNLGVPLGEGDYVSLRGLGSRGAANGQSSTNAAYPSILVIAGAGDVLDDRDIRAVQAAVAAVRDVWPQATKIVGHRDIRATQCPGDHIYGLLQAGRFEPVEEDDDMAILMREDGDLRVYAVSGNMRRWVRSQDHINEYVARGTVRSADVEVVPAGWFAYWDVAEWPA